MKNKHLYIIEFCDIKHNKNEANRAQASVKPHTDTLKTIEKNGGQIVEVELCSSWGLTSSLAGQIIRVINGIYIKLLLLTKLSKIRESVVFMQYPQIVRGVNFTKLLNFFNKRNNDTVLLLHDTESLRGVAPLIENEKKMVSTAKYCIVHSNAMINKLSESGFEGNFQHPLEFFDYLSVLDVAPPTDLRTIRLIFAGNLTKSTFLKELGKIDLNEQYKFFLYGMPAKGIAYNEHIIYKGKFDAEDFSCIEGNWGLVWDGESVNGCSGHYGEYIRINAPFKMSLYLAAKRPVVVWAESAMAEYVKKYNIGVCVESLGELPNVISSLTDEELDAIIRSVEAVSEEVRSGNKLNKIIQDLFFH